MHQFTDKFFPSSLHVTAWRWTAYAEAYYFHMLKLTFIWMDRNMYWLEWEPRDMLELSFD